MENCVAQKMLSKENEIRYTGGNQIVSMLTMQDDNHRQRRLNFNFPGVKLNTLLDNPLLIYLWESV